MAPKGLVATTRLGINKKGFGWLPGWTIVHGYNQLFDQLRAAFPKAVIDPGDRDNPIDTADIFGFAYDFRRSIVDAAEQLDNEVQRRLKALTSHSKDTQRRVLIVAHSMGGLVARQWLGPMKKWPLCRAVVTLGTPHRGAPKALDTLVNGIKIGPLPLSGLTNTLRGWPGVYDLLPTYKAIATSGTEDATEGLYPYELPLAGFAPQAQRAFEMHAEITTSWEDMPRKGPELAAYYGFSHKTLRRTMELPRYVRHLILEEWSSGEGVRNGHKEISRGVPS